MVSLEAPGGDAHPNWEALYRYREEDVNPSRPIFTGDVFVLNGTSDRVMVLQHPCAMRKDGVHLVDKLLVAPVVKASAKFTVQDWGRFYKQMPLPDLLAPDGDHYAALFHKPDVVPGATLSADQRVTSLSLRGVNLLLQRWVHHNSRVIVETHAINLATVEQFEEADLIEEWGDEWLAMDRDAVSAADSAHEWLRSDSGDGVRWQQKLEDIQTRGEVRSAMRAHLKRIAS